MAAEKCKASAFEEVVNRISQNITDNTKQATLNYAVALLTTVMTRYGDDDYETVTSYNKSTSTLVEYFLDGVRTGASKQALQKFARSWASTVANSSTKEGSC